MDVHKRPLDPKMKTKLWSPINQNLKETKPDPRSLKKETAEMERRVKLSVPKKQWRVLKTPKKQRTNNLRLKQMK